VKVFIVELRDGKVQLPLAVICFANHFHLKNTFGIFQVRGEKQLANCHCSLPPIPKYIAK
jgi:hypothetical protein